MGAQLRERRRDLFDFPGPDLLQRRHCRRHEGEIAALAHVVASRSRLEGISIMNQRGEIFAALTGDPVEFQWPTIPTLGGGIEKSEAVGSQKPLVGRGCQKIRSHPVKI